MTTTPPPLIAARPVEDDDEQMFREALERHGAKLMATIDQRIELRSSAPETQRARHLVRGALIGAMTQAMNAYYMHRQVGPARITNTPRSK